MQTQQLLVKKDVSNIIGLCIVCVLCVFVMFVLGIFKPTIMFTENVATFMSENIDDFSENEKCSLRLFVENFVQQTYLDNIRATVRNGVKV